MQGIGVHAQVDTELHRSLAEIVGKTYTFHKLNDFNFALKHQTFTISRIFPERELAPMPAFVIPLVPFLNVNFLHLLLLPIYNLLFVTLLIGRCKCSWGSTAWSCGTRNRGERCQHLQCGRGEPSTSDASTAGRAASAKEQVTADRNARKKARVEWVHY